MPHKDQTTKLLITLFVVFLLAFTAVIPAQAQEASASITGTVLDPGGVPVKDATLTATDTERNTALTTQTNDVGAYNFSRLPVGTYDIKVTAKGFQSLITPKVTLVLNQVQRLDFKMKVGQVTESVEVLATACRDTVNHWQSKPTVALERRQIIAGDCFLHRHETVLRDHLEATHEDASQFVGLGSEG